MSADFVQVAPDSTGAKIQTFLNTIGLDDVETQAVVLVDSLGNPIDLATASGTIADVGENVVIALSAGQSSVRIHITGDFSGNLEAYISSDGGVDYNELNWMLADNSGNISSAPDIGSFVANVAGATHFKVEALSHDSGTATVILRATSAPGPVSGRVDIPRVLSVDDNSGSLTVDGPITDTQLRASPVPVSLPATARTPASSIVAVSGTVTAGKQSVQFIPSNDFTGTLLGAAWPGINGDVGFSVTSPETLAAIAYTVVTGSLTILTVT